MQLSGPWAGDERGLEVMGKPRNRMSLCLRRGAPNGQTNMNFGASHLIQTSALLKKDSKRQLSGVLTLHAAPKGSADLNSFDFHASPRSEVSDGSIAKCTTVQAKAPHALRISQNAFCRASDCSSNCPQSFLRRPRRVYGEYSPRLRTHFPCSLSKLTFGNMKLPLRS